MLNNLLREKDKEELIQIIRDLENELAEANNLLFTVSNENADLILEKLNKGKVNDDVKD